jgi:hypothetical protein
MNLNTYTVSNMITPMRNIVSPASVRFFTSGSSFPTPLNIATLIVRNVSNGISVNAQPIICRTSSSFILVRD